MATRSLKSGLSGFVLIALLFQCLKLQAEAAPQMTRNPRTDLIRIAVARSGRHTLEIDDAASFRTPVFKRAFQGTSVSLHANQEALIPGVRYRYRVDGSAVSFALQLRDGVLVQPGLDCAVLGDTWRENGRFLVGVAHSQLKWQDDSHRWTPVLPAVPLGESLFTAELFLRPALNAAWACSDLPVLDEIALYYTAMLDKSQTIGSLVDAPNLLPESRDRMKGVDRSERTIAARFGPDTIGEGELYNVQWLHPAALLIRLISQLPEQERTPGMRTFAKVFTPFLLKEQILRYLFEQQMPVLGGTTSRGRVAYWELAMSGLQGARRWDTAMSDIDLWLLTSAAELLGAHANDPQTVIIAAEDESMLKKALRVGVHFFQSKRTLLSDTKNFNGQIVGSASYFNGDYDGLSEMRGTAVTGKEYPAAEVAPARAGASWDIGHMYRVAIFLRSLYENRKATNVSFPQYADLLLVVNQYLYKVFNGNFERPLFHNNFDGSDGWFRVGYNGSGFGHPPSSYCNMHDERRQCMTPGSIIGWPTLSFVNPDLERLQQAIIRMAFDKSPDIQSFSDRYYFWLAPFKVIQSNASRICGGAFYAIAAENADKLSPN